MLTCDAIMSPLSAIVMGCMTSVAVSVNGRSQDIFQDKLRMGKDGRSGLKMLREVAI